MRDYAELRHREREQRPDREQRDRAIRDAAEDHQKNPDQNGQQHDARRENRAAAPMCQHRREISIGGLVW